MQLLIRADRTADVIQQVLADPDRFVPAPTKPSQEQKLRARRAVYSFFSELCGQRERLYLKIYRVRTPKDLLEELLFGKRARRSLRMGLEAERRSITSPIHLGASHRLVPNHWPARSALLMMGVPHNRDVRTVLKHELADAPADRTRRQFLAGLGRFVGRAHRLGLIHNDLKIRNLFVVEVEPARLTLIDFDRASFVEPGSEQALFRQARDLRTVVRSLKDRVTTEERRRVQAAYLRARRLSRSGRKRLLRWLAFLGGA